VVGGPPALRVYARRLLESEVITVTGGGWVERIEGLLPHLLALGQALLEALLPAAAGGAVGAFALTAVTRVVQISYRSEGVRRLIESVGDKVRQVLMKPGKSDAQVVTRDERVGKVASPLTWISETFSSTAKER
jgi:hypothetical protein